jgi:hypothetical protein
MSAIRTEKYHGFVSMVAFVEILAADFTLKLASAAIIVVNVVMGCTTPGTRNIFRYGLSVTSLNGFD